LAFCCPKSGDLSRIRKGAIYRAHRSYTHESPDAIYRAHRSYTHESPDAIYRAHRSYTHESPDAMNRAPTPDGFADGYWASAANFVVH
jgi:hypothetical protein